MKNNQGYKVAYYTKINEDSFVHAYTTSTSYENEHFSVKQFEDLSNGYNGYSDGGISFRNEINNIFTGNGINTFYTIESTTRLVENDCLNKTKTEISIENHSSDEQILDGLYIDENFFLLACSDKYGNYGKSLYKYNKNSNLKTMILSRFTREEFEFINKYKNDIYCKIGNQIGKISLDKNEITILFEPTKKFNKEGFEYCVIPDSSCDSNIYFLFNDYKKTIIKIKYNIEEDNFLEEKLDLIFSEGVSGTLKVQGFISDKAESIYVNTNSGAYLEECAYRYSLSKN